LPNFAPFSAQLILKNRTRKIKVHQSKMELMFAGVCGAARAEKMVARTTEKVDVKKMIRTNLTKNCSSRYATDRTGALPLLPLLPLAVAPHAFRNECLNSLNLVNGGGKTIFNTKKGSLHLPRGKRRGKAYSAKQELH
jgi:hypothetical protein